MPFVVPLYPHNHKPAWMFRAGMVAFDALSMRKSVPRHRRLNRKAVAVELPSLRREGFAGALRYYDGQVVFAERLVLETLLSAVDAGALALTYAEVTRVVTDSGRATGLAVRDRISGVDATVRASVVVNAAGPWVDQVAAGLPLPRFIGGTKGTHLVVDPFPGAPDVTVYYEARSDNRPILVIPWNGRYLIGTTDDRFDGDLDTTAGTEAEIDYLLEETNFLLPRARLTRASIRYTYAGVRPLPYRPGAKPGSIPRSHLILTHDEVANLVTVVGGKLTPHLSLGREVVDRVGVLLGRALPRSTTDREPLPGAPADGADWPTEAARLRDELPVAGRGGRPPARGVRHPVPRAARARQARPGAGPGARHGPRRARRGRGGRRRGAGGRGAPDRHPAPADHDRPGAGVGTRDPPGGRRAGGTAPGLVGGRRPARGRGPRHVRRRAPARWRLPEPRT